MKIWLLKWILNKLHVEIFVKESRYFYEFEYNITNKEGVILKNDILPYKKLN